MGFKPEAVDTDGEGGRRGGADFSDLPFDLALVGGTGGEVGLSRDVVIDFRCPSTRWGWGLGWGLGSGGVGGA